MASDFPTSIDPAPAELRDDFDEVRANALQHIGDMATAVQSVVGVGLPDLSAMGGGASQYGSLAQMMLKLSRVETGEIDITWTPDNMADAEANPITTVNLTVGRFTTAPFVMIQTISAQQWSPNTGRRESKLFPVNVGKLRFGVAASGATAGLAAGGSLAIKAHWIAIEPPFGVAETGEVSG